jgi:hypothetical protein
MSTGWKFTTVAGGLVLCVAVMCPGIVSAADSAPVQTHKKAKKPVPPPPLPSGPTGPVQPIPLDSMAPVPPQVSYQNGQLTIVAPNSTLGDILRAVRKQTGAEIEVPSAPERVVTHLGPGPARDVMAELLNGSRFNYVLLGSPSNDALLTRVVLVAKTGPEIVSQPSGPSLAEQPQPGIVQANPGQAQPEMGPDANDAEAAEENTDDNADQAAAEAEQPPANPDQPAVKTPQEMLQEMQQRQLMLQQQQPPGQPPIPGAGVPPRPPQEQQPQQQ